MSPTTRIAGFTVIVALAFAAAALAGSELDPSIDSSEPAEEGEGEAVNADEPLPGLAVAQGGYRLVPEGTELPSGPRATYSFRIVDEDAQTVREFEPEHNRRMHLIVVRRDFVGFQHVHPRQLEDGSWEAQLDLREGGAYRVFADFATAGQSLTLGTDLFVSGAFEPRPLPPVSTTADAGDGYGVELDGEAPSGGATTPVQFTVSRDGRELDSVEPYLGADGHLVALREHDQAYLHTHPEGAPGGSGPIAFDVEYPTEGRYRLFLQFKDRGEVHTAAFTQEARGMAASAMGSGGEEAGDGGH
jgi:hypothetical protein